MVQTFLTFYVCLVLVPPNPPVTLGESETDSERGEKERGDRERTREEREREEGEDRESDPGRGSRNQAEQPRAHPRLFPPEPCLLNLLNQAERALPDRCMYALS